MPNEATPLHRSNRAWSPDATDPMEQSPVTDALGIWIPDGMTSLPGEGMHRSLLEARVNYLIRREAMREGLTPQEMFAELLSFLNSLTPLPAWPRTPEGKNPPLAERLFETGLLDEILPKAVFPAFPVRTPADPELASALRDVDLWEWARAVTFHSGR